MVGTKIGTVGCQLKNQPSGAQQSQQKMKNISQNDFGLENWDKKEYILSRPTPCFSQVLPMSNEK